jgi:DNA-binding transcriptional ArsR family regulator
MIGGAITQSGGYDENGTCTQKRPAPAADGLADRRQETQKDENKACNKPQGTIRRTNINHDWPPVEITLFIIFESAKMSSRKNLSVPMKKNATLEDRAEDAAALLLAMANPRRLLVLCSLLENERSAGDLAEVAAISAAALSQHLTKMRAQGLLKSRRDGQTIYYSLAGSEVRAILQTLYGLFCAPTK